MPTTDRPRRRHRWWTEWWTRPGKVALLALIALVVCAGIAVVATGWYGQFDLRIYYEAMRAWRAGGELYDYGRPDRVMGTLGFTYPPVSALLMWPMSLLGFEAVRWITLAAIVAAGLVLIALLLAEIARREQIAGFGRRELIGVTVVAFPLVFLLEPLRQNLSYGQINLFLALLVVADVLVLGRRGSAWFGIGIGAATALKLTPGIFIVYLLVTGRWRAAWTSIGAAAAATAIAAALAWDQTWEYFTSLLWDSARVGKPETVSNQSLSGLIARFFFPDDAPRAIWAVAVVLVLGVGLWRARKLWQAGDDVAGLAVVGLIGLCVSPISWFHHAVWVLPALLVLGHRWWQLRTERGTSAAGTTRRWLAAAWVFAALAMATQPDNYVRVDPGQWATAAWPQLILAGWPTLAFVLLIAVTPARSRCSATTPPAASTFPAPRTPN